MEESLKKSKPKDHVSPNRQRRANAPNTHDLRERKNSDNLTSETAKLQWMSSSLGLTFLSSWTAAFLFLKSINQSKQNPHLLFCFLTSCTSIVYKCWYVLQWMCIQYLTQIKQHFLDLPWSCWLKKKCWCGRFFPLWLPGKPRGNKITSQSLSMTMAGRYWYTREKWARSEHAQKRRSGTATDHLRGRWTNG